MNITVNGENKSLGVEQNLSVRQLLTELKVKMPEYVSVELNGEILDQAQFDNSMVAEGDQVEFLYFMGGG